MNQNLRMVLAVLLVFLMACAFSTAGQTETQVVATAMAGQTQTALAFPTDTPEPSVTVIPTKKSVSPTTSVSSKTYKNLKLGYVEGCLGNPWFTAYNSSLKLTAPQAGVKQFTYYDSNCNAATQVNKIRDLISAKVDVIGVHAVWDVSESDWESISDKAKAAHIPILFLESIGNASNSAYAAFVHNNFEEEGRQAARAMAKVMNEKGNIVLVHGTEGHPAAEGRKIGFLEAISAYPDLKIIDFANSDFTNDGGYAVMAKFLKAKGSQINGAYFANDEMAFGGIRAIKAAGKKPGVDIKIISTDGSRAGFTAMIAGEINAEVECNPLFGPLFFETALKAANGEMLPREVFVKDSVYFQDVAETELPNRTW